MALSINYLCYCACDAPACAGHFKAIERLWERAASISSLRGVAWRCHSVEGDMVWNVLLSTTRELYPVCVFVARDNCAKLHDQYALAELLIRGSAFHQHF